MITMFVWTAIRMLPLFTDRADFRHAAGEACLQLDFDVEHLGFDWPGEFRRAESVQGDWIIAVDGLPFRVIFNIVLQ